MRRSCHICAISVFLPLPLHNQTPILLPSKTIKIKLIWMEPNCFLLWVVCLCCTFERKNSQIITSIQLLLDCKMFQQVGFSEGQLLLLWCNQSSFEVFSPWIETWFMSHASRGHQVLVPTWKHFRYSLYYFHFCIWFGFLCFFIFCFWMLHLCCPVGKCVFLICLCFDYLHVFSQAAIQLFGPPCFCLYSNYLSQLLGNPLSFQKWIPVFHSWCKYVPLHF